MIIIALTGPKGSGKIFIAEHICREYGAYRVSFADPLKFFLGSIYGGERHFHDPALKDTQHPNSTRTARALMQSTADFFKSMDPNIFAECLVRRLDMSRGNDCVVCIDDLRYDSEMEVLLSAVKDGGHKVIVLRVSRKDLPPREDTHSSENGISDKYVSRTITNDLNLRLDDIIEETLNRQ